MTDPFDLVKDEVQASLLTIDNYVETLSSVPVTELAKLLSHINTLINSSNEDIDVLQQTNDIVYSDRGRFASISDDVLQQRKNVVSSFKHRINKYSSAITSSQSRLDSHLKKERERAQEVAEQRQRRNQAAKTGSDWLKREAEKENDEFITNMERQRQTTMKRQEEEDLQHLGKSVRTMHEIGKEISYELDDQSYLINDIDERIDNTRGLLDTVNQQLVKLMKHKERGRLCCILLLSVVIIVLLFAI
ncbi:hypothetical protein GEMRC1_013780 [Eukaryota sp. GEM-RC1]